MYVYLEMNEASKMYGSEESHKGYETQKLRSAQQDRKKKQR